MYRQRLVTDDEFKSILLDSITCHYHNVTLSAVRTVTITKLQINFRLLHFVYGDVKNKYSIGSITVECLLTSNKLKYSNAKPPLPEAN